MKFENENGDERRVIEILIKNYNRALLRCKSTRNKKKNGVISKLPPHSNTAKHNATQRKRMNNDNDKFLKLFATSSCKR